MSAFELTANIRKEIGSRASRRMRRANNVPAVLYGARKASVSLFIDANELKKKLENEAFGSHVLSLNVDGQKEPAILKAVQRHPVNSRVVHLDLQRVDESRQIQLRIPLHFIDEDVSPAKRAGGVISHLVTEVDVSCLPGNLPETISVDMSEMKYGQTLHLSELTPPEGVVLTALSQGMDQAVATVSAARGMPEEESGTEGTQEEDAESS